MRPRVCEPSWVQAMQHPSWGQASKVSAVLMACAAAAGLATGWLCGPGSEGERQRVCEVVVRLM